MSLLTQQTNANTTETYFLKVNAKVANISTINANTISTNVLTADSISTTMLSAYEGTFSTFSTAQIDLDGQLLTADANDLLLNGIPVATLSSLSSIADWALEPAISSVNMDGFNIVNASTISCQTIVAGQGVIAANLQVGNGLFQNLVAFNSLFVSSNTSTISSLVLNAEVGNFSTLEAGVISTGAIATSDIQASTMEISSINGAEFTTNAIKVDVGNFSSLVSNSISSLGAQIREALISTIVFSPSLNPSLGGVNVNLGLGGILGNVIGWGAGVLGAATGTVALGTSAFALASGRQANYIDATRYELVNGVTQLQFSTLNVPFSTIYRLTDSADPERTPGAEVFVSTINPPGVAVRSVSDPINTLSSPSSTIQAFGQWVPLPPEVVNVSTIADLSVSSLIVSTIAGDGGRIYLNFSTTIDGQAVAPDAGGGKLENFQEITTYNVFTDQIGGYFLPAIEVTNDMTFTSGTGISTNFLNCSGRAAVSSLSTATIEGAASNLYGLGIQGLVIQTDPTGILVLSTSQTNVFGSMNISTMDAFGIESRTASISSLGVSSLTASTIGLGGLSTILFSTAATAGSQSQPAGRLIVSGNDMDFGQQDIWCQQIRLGAGNVTNAPTELVLYDTAGVVKGLNIALQDKTLRIISTLNSDQGGYLLDTRLNPPFFSTINNSTCLVAFFPSTINSTIGISTISVLPPIQVAGSFYSSTSQTVAGANTVTPLTYNSQGVNVGGLTFAGSTITVPIAGTYEINHSIQFRTTSGGTNPVYFWYKKNGNDLAQSASFITLANNAEDLGTISLFDTAAAGDQYACCIASPDTNMTAAFVPVSTIFPAVPSIITNIKRLG